MINIEMYTKCQNVKGQSQVIMISDMIDILQDYKAIGMLSMLLASHFSFDVNISETQKYLM